MVFSKVFSKENVWLPAPQWNDGSHLNLQQMMGKSRFEICGFELL